MTRELDSGAELTPQQERACEMLARGDTLTEVCAALHVDARTLAKQRAQMPAFDREYARAREMGGDILADETLTIRDAELWPDVNRAKAWADSARWLLARRHRDKYGDRLDVGVTVTVDLGQALRDAKARSVRPISDPANAIEGEYVEIPHTCEAGPRDNKSVAPVPALVPPLSIFD